MARSRKTEIPSSGGRPSDVAISKRRRETVWIGFCCLLGGLRIFLYSAALPFLSNIDEETHLDLVCRYARDDVPRGIGPYCDETITLWILYGSPEYLNSPEIFPDRKIPPPTWRLPEEQMALAYQRLRSEDWESHFNNNATQPPVYYALAGIWYDAGKLLGFRGGDLLYWVRFLNIPILAWLVWLSYVFTKRWSPDSSFLYCAVPFLTAIFPQNVFFMINNDVLSAPMATLSLYLLLKVHQSESLRPGLAAFAGLSCAAAFLTKYTNAPVFAIFGIVAAGQLRRAWKSPRRFAELSALALLIASAGLPIIGWFARNYAVLGDLTGLAVKIQVLGWTPKRFDQYGSHPVFTPSGFAGFWWDVLKTFWRGEPVWHGKALAAWPVDAVYVSSSTIFLAAFLIADVIQAQTQKRLASALCLLMFALSVATLIYGSIAYDFGKCYYPSRANPYLLSGRLIVAALIPFLIMYLRGIEAFLGWIRWSRARWPVVLTLGAAIVISEIVFLSPVFSSQYNWFHLG